MCGTSQANNIDSNFSPAGWMLSCAYFILACSAAAPWCTDLAGMLLQDGTVDFGISWYRCMSRHWKREERSAAVLSGVSTERKGRALQLLSFRNTFPSSAIQITLVWREADATVVAPNSSASITLCRPWKLVKMWLWCSWEQMPTS